MHKLSLCSTFKVVVSARIGKFEALDVAVKFEVILACENRNVSKSEIGGHYNLSSSTLFTILKN